MPGKYPSCLYVLIYFKMWLKPVVWCYRGNGSRGWLCYISKPGDTAGQEHKIGPHTVVPEVALGCVSPLCGGCDS